MQSNVYIPSPTTDFVELARSPKGRMFRKQILRYDTFVHPNDSKMKFTVDEAMADTLIKNFKDGICDIVQIPKVGDDNKHTEDVDRNIGRVIDLTKDTDGLYAVMDVRSDEDADKLGKTLLGASAMLAMDYTDSRTGKRVGPTLLHTAITNRPYITNLDDFEEVIAASADTSVEEPVLLLAGKDIEGEQEMPTKEEMIASLKDEYGIDVEALQTEATSDRTEELVSALSGVLKEAGVVAFSGQTAEGEESAITVTDVAEAVVELSQEKIELSAQVADLVKENKERADAAAVTEVDALVSAGKVLPTQKDVMVKLAREDRETFEALIPEQAIVSLSEEGVTVHDRPGNEEFDAEVERLRSIAQPTTGGK